MLNKYDDIMEKLEGHFSDELLLGPTLDDADLNAIEAPIGHALPEDYREFLRKYAGIRTRYVTFPMWCDGEMTREGICQFYGASAVDVYNLFQDNLDSSIEIEYYPGINLVKTIPEDWDAMGWPKELLPIGYSDGLNCICLALFGHQPGAIFFWLSNPTRAQNLYLIANSFDEFMRLLERDE